MNIRLLATDLDGTLLNSQGAISEENFRAIHILSENGIHFVPASGRSYSEMPEALRSHPDIRYYLYSNGAAVLDRQTGERIEMCIPKALSNRVLDVLFGYEAHITYRHGGVCIGDAAQQNDDAYAYYNVWQRHREVVEQYGVYEPDFKTRAYDADGVEMFAVYFHSEAEFAACKRRLADIDGIGCAEIAYCGLEIFSSSAGKGKALLALADHLGIPHEQTAAVGDSDNDRSMILAAGHGLVVSNGNPSLKEDADTVICSNDEHAIDWIVRHCIG
ncbi:MAG: HAD family phosphatase [Clostridia bacterium]|nr:HAD family phosphatase [Clostridia bacterium]